MIRRDICLADGSPGWMLISQIEHARVSGELAARCCGAEGGAVSRVPDEVVAAIGRHDDGWAAWEASPKMDPEHGWPLSFVEVAPADAMAIWSRSIEAAATIGPLAAWVVAGHFLRLAHHSDAAQLSAGLRAWQAEMEACRSDWLAAWNASGPVAHTHEKANDALQWLWTFDEASLWLCCSCSSGKSIPCSPEPFRAGRGTAVEMEFSTDTIGVARVRPWRFDADSIDISLTGQAVPARRYRNWHEVSAAAVPSRLAWRLTRRN